MQLPTHWMSRASIGQLRVNTSTSGFDLMTVLSRLEFSSDYVAESRPQSGSLEVLFRRA